jgi:glucose-6-phosphate isomerase
MTTPSETPKMHPLTKRPQWKALEEHYQKMRNVHMRSLFADDPQRGDRLVAEGTGIYLDFSKNRITDETMQLLVKLAEECGLRENIDAMFQGKKINITENRAVLHTALRMPPTEKVLVDGIDVVPEVQAVLNRMAAFSEKVRSGQWRDRKSVV